MSSSSSLPSLKPLSQHRCSVYGYGVSVRRVPEICPMCHDAVEWNQSDEHLLSRIPDALARPSLHETLLSP